MEKVDEATSGVDFTDSTTGTSLGAIVPGWKGISPAAYWNRLLNERRTRYIAAVTRRHALCQCRNCCDWMLQTPKNVSAMHRVNNGAQ